MEVFQSCFVLGDDFLNFTLEEVDAAAVSKGGASASASYSSGESAASFGRGTQTRSFPEYEEELEWLSNKDAFPSVETCFGILSDNPELVSNLSPISVLENTTKNPNISIKVPIDHPVRARTKRSRMKREGFGSVFFPWKARVNKKRDFSVLPRPATMKIGRRCMHCQTDTTPQWRAGPNGPKTLCNACGVRFKSGRLLPEYRPANSPTFSSVLHSNSHRKVVEMRKRKDVGPGEGVAAANVAGSG